MNNPLYQSFLDCQEKIHVIPEENNDIQEDRILLSQLNFSCRAQIAFKHRLNIYYVDQLIKFSYNELKEIRNIGKVTLNEIREVLFENGFYLKEDIKNQSEKNAIIDSIKKSKIGRASCRERV